MTYALQHICSQEDFGFNKHIAQQIGNAVPVLLAEVLGGHIVSLVNG